MFHTQNPSRLLFLFTVLTLELLAPHIVYEKAVMFTFSVDADRDVAAPVTLYVFTFTNEMDGSAHGKNDIVQLCGG